MAVSSYSIESPPNLVPLSPLLSNNSDSQKESCDLAVTIDVTFLNQNLTFEAQGSAGTCFPENDKILYGSDTLVTGEYIPNERGKQFLRSSIRNKVYSGLRLDQSILEASALRMEKVIEDSCREEYENSDEERENFSFDSCKEDNDRKHEQKNKNVGKRDGGFQSFEKKELRGKEERSIQYSEKASNVVQYLDEDWENLPSRYWLALSEKETEDFPIVWPNCKETSSANGVKKPRLVQNDSCVLLDELRDFCSMERIIAAQERMQNAAHEILEAEMQVQRLQKMEEETNKVIERTKDVTQKRRASSSPRQRVFWLVDWFSGRNKSNRERN